LTEHTPSTTAAVIHRIEHDDHTVAADLSRMLARGELRHEAAVECVPHAWRWNNRPLADLPQQQWIQLFRFAGYTHDYAPAARPTGRAVRLWRGGASAELLSWTSDRKLARGFAIRNAGLDSNVGVFGEPTLWVALVDPARLLGYFSSEKEYIIDPLGVAAEHVRVKR
jgi:hypothetical protein